MRKLFLFLVLTSFISEVSAQVQKYLSSEQVIVNVDFTQVKGYDKVNLVFNFDTKMITLSNQNTGSKFTFTMVSVSKEYGTMIGDTYNIIVKSTNAPAVKRFFFSLDTPGAIFMENKDSKTTTFGSLQKL